MFEKIRNSISDVREVREFASQTMMKVDEAPSFHGYKVFVCDGRCVLTGMSTRIPGALAMFTPEGEPLIVINTKMMSMPESFREAVMLHEIGHLVLHKDIRVTKWSMIKRVFVEPEMEYEADAYSQAHGGDMITALEEYTKYGAPHIKSRIKRLKSLINN